MKLQEKEDKKNWLRLNIQHFAEGGDGGSDGGDGGSDGGEDKPQVLTAEEVQKMIQAEADRVRGEYSKKNKELQKLLDDEKKSKLTEQEKFELAQKELADKENELKKEKNAIHATRELSNSELPSTFLDFVTSSEGDEKTTELVKTLKKAFDDAVAAKVDETFKGTGRTVHKGTGAGNANQSFDFADIAAENNIRKH